VDDGICLCLAIGLPLDGTGLKGAHRVQHAFPRTPWHFLARKSTSSPLYLSPDDLIEMERDDSDMETLQFRASLPQESRQPLQRSQSRHEEAESSPVSYKQLMVRYLKNQPAAAAINIADSESDSKVSSFVEFSVQGRQPFAVCCCSSSPRNGQDRLWPLPDVTRQTQNTKRIDSFLVAKSAMIEPGQVSCLGSFLSTRKISCRSGQVLPHCRLSWK
jgi:hypothetical protein